MSGKTLFIATLEGCGPCEYFKRTGLKKLIKEAKRQNYHVEHIQFYSGGGSSPTFRGVLRPLIAWFPSFVVVDTEEYLTTPPTTPIQKAWIYQGKYNPRRGATPLSPDTDVTKIVEFLNVLSGDKKSGSRREKRK